VPAAAMTAAIPAVPTAVSAAPTVTTDVVAIAPAVADEAYLFNRSGGSVYRCEIADRHGGGRSRQSNRKGRGSECQFKDVHVRSKVRYT
jgi:hypothetical protein